MKRDKSPEVQDACDAFHNHLASQAAAMIAVNMMAHGCSPADMIAVMESVIAVLFHQFVKEESREEIMNRLHERIIIRLAETDLAMMDVAGRA